MKSVLRRWKASFEALEISITSSCLLVAEFWHLCDKMKAVECNFNLRGMSFSLFLALKHRVNEHIARLCSLLPLLQFIQFIEKKRNKREVELAQENYTDVRMTASECLVWNFPSRFMHILKGWSILKWLALHIGKPFSLQSWQQLRSSPLFSHLPHLGNRSAAGFSSPPVWLFPAQYRFWVKVTFTNVMTHRN